MSSKTTSIHVGFLTTLLSLTIFTISPVDSSVVGQYEQFCSDSNDCSQSQGLTCQSNRCKCAPGGETVFSLGKNRCVGAAGRECLRSGNETLCVDNSICRDYNYMFLCVCAEGFYQSRDGNCYKIAQYGESCREEDYACGDSVTTSISCLEKRCACLLGENQYYDQVEGRCISYAGSQCLFHYPTPCSDNSYCGEIAENINGASFVVGHRCLCKLGYSYTRNRKCLGKYLSLCDGTKNPCNYDDHLGCVNSRCQCRDPLNQAYDEQSNQCRILVNSRCDPEGGPKCIPNADCIPQKLTTNNTATAAVHRCECSPGFSATPLGTCLIDINQRCEPGSCNHYNALTCVNGTCACVDSSLTYDKKSKICVAMIGQPCGQVQVYDTSVTNMNEVKEIMVLCEGNAICSKNHVYSGVVSNGAGMKRICRVPSNTVATAAKNN